MIRLLLQPHLRFTFGRHCKVTKVPPERHHIWHILAEICFLPMIALFMKLTKTVLGNAKHAVAPIRYVSNLSGLVLAAWSATDLPLNQKIMGSKLNRKYGGRYFSHSSADTST